MRRLNSANLVLACTLGSAEPARAQPVAVFNTGVDNASALLPDRAVDPHFALVQYPGQVGTTPAPTYALAGITSTYIVSGTQSRWISWSPDWINATPSGVWVYRTTFDLTNVLPGTARLTGQFTSDNDGTLFLNGVNTGAVSTSAGAFAPFAITSGFVSGINTVDFRVINDPFVAFNPSALRADLNVTATPVPEPSAVVLSCVGALGLYLARNRRSVRVTWRWRSLVPAGHRAA